MADGMLRLSLNITILNIVAAIGSTMDNADAVPAGRYLSAIVYRI